MPRPRGHGVSILILGAILVRTALAVAAGSSRHTAEVAVAAGGEDQAALMATIRELLARLGVSVRGRSAEQLDPAAIIGPPTEKQPAIARVWIDLTHPGRATIYVAGDPWDRVVVRHVPLDPGTAELAREEIAHIVETSVEAMLSGARPGIERPPPEEAASEPPAGGGHFAEVEVALRYETTLWSEEHPFVHGPQVSATVLGAPARIRRGIEVSGQLRLPSIIREVPVGFRIDHGALRLVGLLEVPLASRVALRLGAGGGADILRIEPRLYEQGATLEPVRTAVAPMVRALAALVVRIARRAQGVAAFAVDVDLAGTRFLLRRGTRDDVIFQPWRVRPSLFFGLALRGN